MPCRRRLMNLYALSRPRRRAEALGYGDEARRRGLAGSLMNLYAISRPRRRAEALGYGDEARRRGLAGSLGK